MNVKTLKFDQDVIDVLKDVEWREGGKLCVIATQLDRKLYEKVNKALEAAGGAWNRKLKAHAFTEDPRPFIEGLVENGEVTVENYSFFPTPGPVIRQMLMQAKFLSMQDDISGIVLEPSAGDGAIVAELQLFSNIKRIDVVELNYKHIPHLTKMLQEWNPTPQSWNVINSDFLDVPVMPIYDYIFMNPPFENGQDVAHVTHALKFLKSGGVLVAVMPVSVKWRTEKRYDQFRAFYTGLSQFHYIDDLPIGSFKTSGTAIQTVLFSLVRK